MLADEVIADRGMLDLDRGDRHYGGIARCCAADCGWEGIPVYVKGEPQTWCPKCEGWSEEFGEEPDLNKFTLRHDVHIRFPRRRSIVKQGRNDPCACGSGLKWKRCHGR